MDTINYEYHVVEYYSEIQWSHNVCVNCINILGYAYKIKKSHEKLVLKNEMKNNIT